MDHVEAKAIAVAAGARVDADGSAWNWSSERRGNGDGYPDEASAWAAAADDAEFFACAFWNLASDEFASRSLEDREALLGRAVALPKDVKRVVVIYDPPPGPTRKHYFAQDDDDNDPTDGHHVPQGWGEDEEEAIKDLMEAMDHEGDWVVVQRYGYEAPEAEPPSARGP